jgi:hypothetical protein
MAITKLNKEDIYHHGTQSYQVSGHGLSRSASSMERYVEQTSIGAPSGFTRSARTTR